MSKTYSAGIVTAYGAAKRAGYQGTYEDFCRQQAGYAGNAAAVEQAKQDAQTARNQAQTAKDDAVSAKNTAVGAKDDAVSAKNTAVSAKDDAVSAKNTATTKAQEASASATSAGQSATSADQSARSAEQSAQGVSGSLAQIATNTADISQIKADLDENVSDLKSALKYRTEFNENNFNNVGEWGANRRINSVGKMGTGSTYVGTASGLKTPFLLAGSTITVNEGYVADYAFWSVPCYSATPLDNRILLKRYNTAGTTFIVPQDCYVLFSCAYADGSDLPDNVNPTEFANSAFTVNLYNKQVKDYIPKIDDLNDFVLKANTPIDIINETVWPTNVANMNGRYLGRLQDNETIEENSSYYTSVYMQIKPNQQYTNRTSNTKIHFYDYAKNPISVISLGENGTFVTPTNAVYARMTTNSQVSWQINEGDALLGYTAWTPLKIDSSAIAEKGSEYNHGSYDLYPARFANWYSGLQTDYTAEGFSRTSTYSEVIAAFDGLMTLAPDYITKNTLGVASGLDANNNAYTIYEYVFKPKRYNSTLNTAKMPKVYMDGSIHGFEKCSTYGLYYFLKDVVTKWQDNSVLEAIRQSVELHIIPVSNPYGFDNNIYKNGNAVNINRNFDHPGEWVIVPDGSDQNGLAAFDQPESAIIRDWLLAGKNEVLFYANLHTNGQWNASGYEEMNVNMPDSSVNDEYYKRIYRVFVNHIDEQTLQFSKMYPAIQPTANRFCGKIQALPVNGGHASAWASTMQHIVSLTLEGFNGLMVEDTQIVGLFSADAFKINAENIGNMVIQMLREYAT